MSGKVKKLLLKAWKVANSGDVAPSLKQLASDLKYELKYDKRTGKMAGDMTKSFTRAPSAKSGAKLLGKAIAKATLPVEAGVAAYRIGKAWKGANDETKKNLKETSERSDELISAIRRQRFAKRKEKKENV